MSEEKKSPYEIILENYRNLVQQKHPDLIGTWPILSGADLKQGALPNGWSVFFFDHTGNPVMRTTSSVGQLPSAALRNIECNEQNLEQIRAALWRHFRATREDAIILIPPTGELPQKELVNLLQHHETVMGIARIKIFLCHKSPDKAKVREFKETLSILGFDPWLDEDAMAAGVQLDRSILQGMKDSCAAVFFLTPNFSDEKFLATEINYAIAEHRERSPDFAIIALGV